jgi:Thioredoxin domain-containing protein
MKKTIIWSFAVIILVFSSCSKKENQMTAESKRGTDSLKTVNHKIEFVELGSVNCIPCKKMQPIMQSIEKKYAGLVKVTFYDVWKDPSKQEEFGIDLIPTQVFRDAGGKEIMRHQGFFPEEQIDAFLKTQGLNPVN